ncbi:MAG TPA: 1-acyl-sn-glycerol-3-phosphate acyltransferase [Candidatus Nanopelagicaceae bacterium]|nr:1-acyl-sn-glycerol-3-phosphate acyltransferase [Candidatus Nanopelagicaceae bacterium]
MVEASTEEKETKGKDKVVSKDLMKDLLYAVTKGIGGFGFEAFADLKIEGKENVPIIGKAILVTVSDNALRDMAIISQVSGRRIHFMVHHKLMKHQVYGPVLKLLGMFRSTLDKDDTVPIDKVFHYLNEVGDLVAMTPESKLTPEVQVKAMAGIIKFAVAAMAPIIPIAIYTEKARILNTINTTGIRVKIGTSLKVEKRLTREKNRDERYELAEDIIKIINSLKVRPEKEQE